VTIICSHILLKNLKDENYVKTQF